MTAISRAERAAMITALEACNDPPLPPAVQALLETDPALMNKVAIAVCKQVENPDEGLPLIDALPPAARAVAQIMIDDWNVPIMRQLVLALMRETDRRIVVLQVMANARQGAWLH